METILYILNYGKGRVRRVTRNGRDYLVVPMRLIVPGVLPGSRGPLFYPAEEIARNPSDWNGMPITIRHPTRNGVHVSARQPDIESEFKVGHIYDTKVVPSGEFKGSLDATGWFDVEDLKRVDNRVYALLQKGQPVELSTGLFTNNEPAPPGAVDRQGRQYDYIARDYKPDHVAVLPDEVGACSLKDGCGVMVNARRGKPLKIAANGWVTMPNGVPVFVEDGEITKGPKALIGRTKDGKGKGKGGKKDKDDKPIKGKLRGSADDNERRFQEASSRQDAREKAQSKAARSKEAKADLKRMGKLLDKKDAEAKGGKSEEPAKQASNPPPKKVVVAYGRNPSTKTGSGVGDKLKGLFKGIRKLFSRNAVPNQPKSKATGKFKKPGAGTGKGDVHRAAQQGHMQWTERDRELGKSVDPLVDPPTWATDTDKWLKAKAEAGTDPKAEGYWTATAHIYQRLGGVVANQGKQSDTPEVSVMKLTDKARGRIIRFLQTNCACWKDKDAVKTLNAMSDQRLTSLQKTTQERLDMQAVVNSAKETFGLDANLELNEMPAALAKIKGKGKVVEKEEMEEEDEEEEVAANNRPVKAPKGGRPLAELLKEARPEDRAVWNHAVALTKKARATLVQQLQKIAANTSSKVKKTMILNELKSKPSLEDLEKMVALTQEAEPLETRNRNYDIDQLDSDDDADYTGAGAPGLDLTDNSNGDDSDEDTDVLPLPVTNWAEVSEAHRKRQISSVM